MRQNEDPFYVPDQLSQQIENETARKQQQKVRSINEQREYYQEYLKMKEQNKKVDLPSFKIGQDPSKQRRQHRTVDELNSNVCTNLTKDNVYTQQRMVDQVTYSKRHERDNRNYNIINMAPSGINEQGYMPRIIDGCDINYYDEGKLQDEGDKGYQGGNVQQGSGVKCDELKRGQLAGLYGDNDKQIELSEEERRKCIAYLEYLKKEEIKIKQMSSNDNALEQQQPISSNQYIKSPDALQHQSGDNIFQPNQGHNQQLQPSQNKPSLPIDHYHQETVNLFNQNPDAKRIDNPYVDNYNKINSYYEQQKPISSYNVSKPPYGIDDDIPPKQMPSKQPNEPKGQLDLQEEARKEYFSNKMKNVSTYTNLTHMTSLNPSLKCQPIQPPITTLKPSTEKLKQQQYKQLLDDQLQARQSIPKEDRLNNPYSKQQFHLAESALENNPISRPYTTQQFKK